MSLSRVIRGSAWLYVSSIAFNFLGYLYWIIASRFVPTSTVGAAAAILNVTALVVGIFGLGLSSGATRLFGQAWGRNDRTALSSIFLSTFITSIAINASAALMILLFGRALGLSNFEVPFIAVFIILSAILTIPDALYTSTIRTNVYALSLILSAIARLAIGVVLLYLGMGFPAVMAAWIVFYIVQNAVLLVMLRGLVHHTRFALRPSVESLKTGLAYWIPSLTSTAGASLGVIGIYSIVGSAQAGTYYMAFNISQIVYTVPLAIFGLMFPVLSGMKDGRKQAAGRSINFVYAIIAPLAAAVMAFAFVPLSLLGPSYVTASLSLQLLMLGCFVYPISAGFNSLVYAYGKYKYVFMLGLVINIPRAFLYAPLVALWGNSGAAISYVMGLFIVLPAVFVMARRTGYSVGWGSSFAFSAIPFSVALLMMFTHINWVVGTLVILAVSFFAYARLGLVKRSDLVDVSSAFLSKKQMDSVYIYTRYILKALYGE